ncbi:MAG: hypothetical protein IPN71_12400 [Fibrobacteres bacterium]|nr:hypothetical protein [Fibrobacterota bacterium]
METGNLDPRAGAGANALQTSLPWIPKRLQTLWRSATRSRTERTRGKFTEDFSWLMGSFRSVLEELGETDLAAQLPWIGKRTRRLPTPERLAQAYSICFQLLNMAEENGAAQMRRAEEEDHGLSRENGLGGIARRSWCAPRPERNASRSAWRKSALSRS